MRGSLGLSAYRTLSGRKAAPPLDPVSPRPKGELVWIHSGEDGNSRALIDLAYRMLSVRPGLAVLVTTVDTDIVRGSKDGIIFEDLPTDHPGLTAAFVAHWKPDVVVWAWGGLRPNLVLAASDAGARMMLVDAASDGFDRRRDRWLPEVPRRLLERFDVFIARSPQAQARLLQLGRTFSQVEVAAPLRPFGRMLPAAESDIADMTATLRGRPVWLAAMAHEDEIDTLIAAHRTALKSSHRLLLILLLSDPKALLTATSTAQRNHLGVALWSVGEMPDDTTQVLVADAEDELGLWLRVAPVTFVGGSLSVGRTCIDPYPAAAHGAAILFGPYTGEAAVALDRLRSAGAALQVSDAPTLAKAVTRTIAPDLAAQMAMAGWDVTTAGAEGLDRIVHLVQAHLDAKQDGLA